MSIMSGLGSKVSSRPTMVIAIILAMTLVLGYFGSFFVNEADPESFNPDHELIMASQEAGDLFGTEEYNLLIPVKAKDNNILEIQDLKDVIEFEAALRNDSVVSPAIVGAQNNPTGVSSLAGLMVMSYGLLQAREGMDLMLSNFDQGLGGLVALLENTTESNITKAYALDAFLKSLNENLTLMQDGNNGMSLQFDRATSLATLDAISFTYASPPVPTYLDVLENYDMAGAMTQTSIFIGSIDAMIDSIMPYLPLLNGTAIDPQTGAMILGGFDMALPTLSAQAQTLDGTIVGLYYGASATLTRDYGTSGGLNAKGTIMIFNFNVSLDDGQRYRVENKVHDLADSRVGDLEYGVLGNELINEEIQNTMDMSGMVLLMLVFILIIIILFITFRNGFDTLLTLVSLGMAIVWSYGISILLGIQGSIIATVVPILLVGLGVDYGIHMTMRFREEKAKDRGNPRAIAIAIGTVGMALLLATVTTSIGFMSNTVSSLSILKDFAIMVTAGIVSSFIIMTTFLPAVKLVVTEWRDKGGENTGKTTEPKVNKVKNNSKKHAVSVVTIGAKAADRAPWAVLIILFIVSGIAGYGASQLDTVFDFREFIPRDTEAYDNYVFLIDEFEFGDVEYGEFYFTGDVATPEVLLAMDETIANTNDDDQVVTGFTPRSILSVMQDYANPASQSYNQSFSENWTSSDTDGDGIPNDNVKSLFDMLYNCEASCAEVMSVVHRTETGEYDAALIQVRVTSDNLKKADLLQKELNSDAAPLKELKADGTLEEVYVIGEPVVVNVVVTEMNEGQIRSIIITIAASFIVLTIVFLLLERSFILGFITMIPVVLVILWILGTMILFGYSLNVMTITIASLTVGMGITYSIHVSERFTEDLRNFKTPGEACENTLTHTGMALAGAFLTTSGGFGILFFHNLPPLQQFGVMIALSIAYSFFASVYVLPTFLVLWAKWRANFRNRRISSGEEERAGEEDRYPHDDVGAEEGESKEEVADTAELVRKEE